MVNWFGRGRERRRTQVDAPRIRPRSTGQAAASKIDLAQLTPSLTEFLGKSAYLELMLFEDLSRVVSTAPTTESKTSLSQVAGMVLARHHGLTAEIERHGADPAEIMQQYAAEIDRFQRVTKGADWYESLTAYYLVSGFLGDFLVRLAAGLTGAAGARVVAILEADAGESLVVTHLLSAIEKNPLLGARLAMWGRRLVGDTMLIARWTLRPTENHDATAAQIEPVFTELIAAHTRRMDALGLTA